MEPLAFFGVEFYFQPYQSTRYTKQCPAPSTPVHLIKELTHFDRHGKDIHFSRPANSLFRGWIISQTLGFWAGFRLFVNVFSPWLSTATTTSFDKMDRNSRLSIENIPSFSKENGLQVGYKVEEMADRVENLLISIRLIDDFSSTVYVIGHGSSSVNNTHYAAYDCGACSGKPGAVNARVFAFMANHPKVRELLTVRGIFIPDQTQFVAALHDTTRDDIVFFCEESLSADNLKKHRVHQHIFGEALDLNAKERSRRFELIDTKESARQVHRKVRARSVSLFEPRPELNHATNALCIIGHRNLSRGLFLDRRLFMNSYDYNQDPEGKFLYPILKAAAPVCGGINLEYYFSRMDNEKLGAGSKLPHNVMGLLGVANGIDGDFGIIFMEVAAGLENLALLHFAGNAILRTYQLLVSPSVVSYLIREQFYIQATGNSFIYNLMPKKIATAFYILGLKEWKLDSLMYNLLWNPLKFLGQKLNFITVNRIAAFFIPLYLLGLLLTYNPDYVPTVIHPYLPVISCVIGLVMVFKAFSERKNVKLSWILVVMNHLWVALAISFNERFPFSQIHIYLSGIILAGIFGYLCLRKLRKREKHVGLSQFHGYIHGHPGIAAAFFLSCLGIAGFPITPTFIGEDLIFTHIRENQVILAFFVSIGFVLNGLTVVRIYARVFLGPHVKSQYELTYRSS